MPRLWKRNLRDMEIKDNEQKTMNMTRRYFGKLLTGIGGIWRTFRATIFPGRIKPLDSKTIRHPGKWKG